MVEEPAPPRPARESGPDPDDERVCLAVGAGGVSAAAAGAGAEIGEGVCGSAGERGEGGGGDGGVQQGNLIVECEDAVMGEMWEPFFSGMEGEILT